MILVERLFPDAGNLKTEVWISDSVRETIAEQAPEPFLAKLNYAARSGFWELEGKRNALIRPEWDEVYRIGMHANLFRVYGFYEAANKRSFIGLDAFTKKGQELRAAERSRITEVGQVKRESEWRKREE